MCHLLYLLWLKSKWGCGELCLHPLIDLEGGCPFGRQCIDIGSDHPYVCTHLHQVSVYPLDNASNLGNDIHENSSVCVPKVPNLPAFRKWRRCVTTDLNWYWTRCYGDCSVSFCFVEGPCEGGVLKVLKIISLFCNSSFVAFFFCLDYFNDFDGYKYLRLIPLDKPSNKTQ